MYISAIRRVVSFDPSNFFFITEDCAMSSTFNLHIYIYFFFCAFFSVKITMIFLFILHIALSACSTFLIY